MVDRAAQLADDACEVDGAGVGEGDEDGQGEDAGPDVPEFGGWGWVWKFHVICGLTYNSGIGILF